MQLTFEIAMPVLPLNEIARQLVQLPGNRIFLSIPTSLSSVLRELMKMSLEYRSPGSRIAQDINETIKDLNKSYCLLLSRSRISTYMYSHLAGQGIDEVVIKRIRGTSLRNNVPQHYDACSVRLTQSVFRKYVSELLASVPRVDDWPAEEYANDPIGSRLNVRPEKVRRYFQCWVDRIKSGIEAKWDPIYLHNEYVLATHAILSICTGQRPVRQPFENIRDFDPASRELVIADKSSRSDADTRCIVLPKIAAQQFELYVQHLRALQLNVGSRNLAAVRAAKRALSGKGPLLFFVIKQDEDIDQIVALNPGVVSELLSDRWPLDLRWPRHFLCTQSRSSALPHEAINAVLGHNDLAPSAFNPFSGLSYRKMVDVADAYGALLAGLGIKPMQGLS